MNTNAIRWGFLFILALFGCEQSQYSDNQIYRLSDDHPEVRRVLDQADRYRVQILYSGIRQDSAGNEYLDQQSFRLDDDEYFYPASTVKMPVAFLALEKLNELNIEGLDKNTPMFTDSAFSAQTPVRRDTTSASGLPSVGHYIRKIFLVSDNDAFNRLYEFLGQDYINRKLHDKGYASARIVHRLSIPMTEDENRHTNPVYFVEGTDTLYSQPLVQAVLEPDFSQQVRLGKGDMAGGELVEGPKDFSRKNRISLQNLHQILIAVVRPELVPESQRFDLTEEDRAFLLEYMSMLPGESDYPSYDDPEHYWDSYVKFLMFGDSQEPIPGAFRIYNKVGLAYGFCIDVAYITNEQEDVHFFLSAVIHTNDNGIFNDNAYEYDETAFPFLAELGRMMYGYEVQRSE